MIYKVIPQFFVSCGISFYFYHLCTTSKLEIPYLEVIFLKSS